LIEQARSSRRFLVLAFALLLLGMQQESLLHALSHFKPAQEQQQLSPPSDAPCLECALLAAGSSALPSAAPGLALSPGPYVVFLPALVAPALARFTPHCSRAPPSLS
jgi:hypothetical protein